MESKVKLNLKCRIEEKPGGGWVARSDNPAMETIEGATKEELFEKMRARTAALIGAQLPMNFGSLLEQLNASQTDRNVVVNIDSKRKVTPEDAGQYIAANDSTPLAEQRASSGNLWKFFFFVLLAAVIAWFFLNRR
jgi:hypothetical protein